MTINERIAAIEAELEIAEAAHVAAEKAYDEYDLNPTHFKDADRSARLAELFEVCCEKATATREIGARLDELKRERFVNSKQGQLYANLLKSLNK